MSSTLEMWADGGLLGRRNPSPEGIYWSAGWRTITQDRTWRSIRQETKSLHTNNDAEWNALITALFQARFEAELCEISHVIINMDSRLVVNQFNGKARCVHPRLYGYQRIAYAHEHDLMELVQAVTVRWVPRKQIVERLGH